MDQAGNSNHAIDSQHHYGRERDPRAAQCIRCDAKDERAGQRRKQQQWSKRNPVRDHLGPSNRFFRNAPDRQLIEDAAGAIRLDQPLNRKQRGRERGLADVVGGAGEGSVEVEGGEAVHRRPAQDLGAGAALGGQVADGDQVVQRRVQHAERVGRRSVVARPVGGRLGRLRYFALFGFVFLITQYFQFVRDHSALGTGSRILPVATSIAVASILGGALAPRIGTKVVVATRMTLLGSAAGALFSALALPGCGFVPPHAVVDGSGPELATANLAG